MLVISSLDLQSRGMALLEASLQQEPEAIISIQGQERFVVMEMAHYHYLRECELALALAESRADLAAGRFLRQSAEEHLASLKALA